MINITNVRLTKGDWGKTKAMASITIDETFVVTGIKVVEGQNGYFVAMPSRKAGEEYKDICFPITKEARECIEATVLQEYEQEGQQQTQKPTEKEVEEDMDGELPF